MAEDLKLESALVSKLDVKAPRFGANRAALQVLMAALRVEEDEIRLGGGAKAAEAQKAKGRLTVRERLALLLDEGSGVSGVGTLGGAWDVWRVWRCAGSGSGDGSGAGERAAVHDRGE